MREEEKLPKELANYHMGFNAAHSKVSRRFLPLCNCGFSDSWYSTLQWLLPRRAPYTYWYRKKYIYRDGSLRAAILVNKYKIFLFFETRKEIPYVPTPVTI